MCVHVYLLLHFHLWPKGMKEILKESWRDSLFDWE